MTSYERKLDIAVPVPMPVDASLLWSQPVGKTHQRSVAVHRAGGAGDTLDMYSGSNLEAGSVLDVTLSGKVSNTPPVEKGDTTSLLIGGGVLGLVLVGAGYWLWRSNKKDEEEVEVMGNPETAEEIMDAIITLDDRYKAGDLPEDAYQARRAELKAKLESIMK